MVIGPHVYFKRQHFDVMDSKATVRLVVERSQNKGSLCVRYTTRDGTARDGEHYNGKGLSTLYFAHGEAVASIEIGLIDSAFHKATYKSFTVRLLPGTDPTEATAGRCVPPLLSSQPLVSRRRCHLYNLKQGAREAEVRIWDNGSPNHKQSLREIVEYGITLHANAAGGSSTNPFGAGGANCSERVALWFFYGQTPLNSQSEIMTVYDMLGFLMILFTAIVTPFQLAFLEEKGRFEASTISFVDVSMMWYIDRVVDGYFFCDICVNFFRPVMDAERGVEIIHLSEIRSRYLRGPFSLDCLSTIPFDVLAQSKECELLGPIFFFS